MNDIAWITAVAVLEQGQKEATAARDLLAKKMTAARIAKAQKLTREWKPKK